MYYWACSILSLVNRGRKHLPLNSPLVNCQHGFKSTTLNAIRKLVGGQHRSQWDKLFCKPVILQQFRFRTGWAALCQRWWRLHSTSEVCPWEASLHCRAEKRNLYFKARNFCKDIQLSFFPSQFYTTLKPNHTARLPIQITKGPYFFWWTESQVIALIHFHSI